MSAEQWSVPSPVSDIDIAFAARGPELTPDYEDVPDEFKRSGSVWVRFIDHWFFRGNPTEAFEVGRPRDGVDAELAFRHLKVVLGTFGTKHEHKTAGAAWLLSLWFEDVKPR